MSVELISVLIAVLAVGATLARVILTSSRGLRQDMARMESRLREDMKQLGERVARIEHGQAKLEGYHWTDRGWLTQTSFWLAAISGSPTCLFLLGVLCLSSSAPRLKTSR